MVGVLEAGGSYDDGSQNGCHNAGPEPIAYYGFGTLAAGAGMTTVGWLMFAHSRAHFRWASRSATAPEQTQQHQEQIDEVEIQHQRAL